MWLNVLLSSRFTVYCSLFFKLWYLRSHIMRFSFFPQSLCIHIVFGELSCASDWVSRSFSYRVLSLFFVSRIGLCKLMRNVLKRSTTNVIETYRAPHDSNRWLRSSQKLFTWKLPWFAWVTFQVSEENNARSHPYDSEMWRELLAFSVNWIRVRASNHNPLCFWTFALDNMHL